MLKRLIFAVGLAVLLVGPVWAGTDINTAGQFMARLRLKTNIYDTVLAPDSVLLRLTQEACLTVSTEVGGYQKTFRVNTVAGQAFYALQDSLVEVISAVVLSGGNTKSIKAFYPQFWEDAGNTIELGGESGETPGGYIVWNDSVQLLPAPIQVDSIYFKCFYEHPLIDSSADSVYLKAAYTLLAVIYGQHLVYEFAKDYEQSDKLLTKYEEKAKKLVAKYTPKFDVAKQ
ncbi:MAG: hypothetical protein WC356_04250 [Candidatus Micrarchaeia archaeon]|jgi:hypothetical protein